MKWISRLLALCLLGVAGTLSAQDTSAPPLEFKQTDGSGTPRYPTTVQADHTFTAATNTITLTAGLVSGSIDTSAELAAILTDETGSGLLVFGTSPTFITPTLGAASGSTLSLSSTLTLQNGETISNATDGTITFAGVGGTNNEDLTLNFESVANSVRVSSTTGAGVTFLDDTSVWWGNGLDARLKWDTTETNDSLKLGLVVGAAADSGILFIVESADAAVNFGAATVSNPTIRLQSADATTTADWIAFFHNQTNPVIDTGNGTLRINEALSGNGLAVDVQTAQTIASGNTVAANNCGGIKLITADGAVATNTTNTFTAPDASNTGCLMTVQNTGANTITLDANASFLTVGGLDVVMTTDDVVVVMQTGSRWVQISALLAL